MNKLAVDPSMGTVIQNILITESGGWVLQPCYTDCDCQSPVTQPSPLLHSASPLTEAPTA